MTVLDHHQPHHRPDTRRDEEHDVHNRYLVRPLDDDRREPLTNDDSEGIAHPQDSGGHGALAVREPVLGHLGGHTGDEGAGHPGGGLPEQSHPVLNLQRDMGRQPRERAHAAQKPTEAGEKGSDPYP